MIAAIPDGTRYVFAAGAGGSLECDVASDAHISWLLDTGYFFPANESDMDAGVAVAPPPPAKRPYKRAKQ